MRTKRYPSDISREEFEIIRPSLEASILSRRPRQVDLYDIFCGILYILKGGCQWRMLPSDFPKWQNVYRYFRVWADRVIDTENNLIDISTIESLLKQGVKEYRLKVGKDANATLGISDSQSVKNADTAEEKGYDAGKKNFRNKTSYYG